MRLTNLVTRSHSDVRGTQTERWMKTSPFGRSATGTTTRLVSTGRPLRRFASAAAAPGVACPAGVRSGWRGTSCRAARGSKEVGTPRNHCTGPLEAVHCATGPTCRTVPAEWHLWAVGLHKPFKGARYYF